MDRATERSADADDAGKAILGGGIWRVAAFGFATALGVLATAVVSRGLGPEDFALFTTAVSLIAIATSLSDFGLLALGLREFAVLEGEERARSQRALIMLRLILALVSSAGILAFAVLSNYPPEAIAGLAAAAVGLCLLSVHISYCVPIQATYRLGTIAVLELLRQVLTYGLMIVAVLLTSQVGTAIAVYLPVGIVMVVVSGTVARKIAPILPLLDFAVMRRLLGDLGAFAVASSAGAIYAYVAQVLSNAILTPHESGEFALAFRTYSVLIAACMTAVSGAFPLLVATATSDRERLGYATRRVAQTALLGGGFSAVALLTGSAVVVTLIGGAAFDGAETVVALIGLAMPASFLLIVGSNVLLATGRHRQLIVISVVGASVSIVATGLLATALGAPGAAIGICVGETAIAAGYAWELRRMDRGMLPTGRWVFGLGLVIAVSCLAAFLPLPDLAKAVIGAAVFVGGVLIARLLPPELIDTVRQRVRPQTPAV